MQWEPKRGRRSLKVVHATHQPQRGGAGHLILRWTTDFGFDRAFELWVCARDVSGNHACTQPFALHTPKNPKHLLKYRFPAPAPT